ncbi:tyrosine-type recombinase/integrase [Aquibaculum sediminis]|uniref:tyrosine-type recombinase/integrase n=1 Tax=Aquibaculum sediminis TaxID=3231907 RepID=UPI0034570B2E
MPDYDFNRKQAVRTLLRSGQKGEFNDPTTPGLHLRIGAAARWSLKGRLHGRKSTWRIGDASVPVKEARLRAEMANKLLKRGEDPRGWLQEQELGGAVQAPPRDVDWPWERVRDAYIEAKSQALRPASITSLKQSLYYRTVTQVLVGKDISEVSREELIRIRDSILADGKEAQARKCVRDLNALFRYMHAERPDIPIENIRINQSPGNRPRRPRTGAALPTLAQLGQAEARLRNGAINAHQRLASLLVLFTAQRISSVASAKPDDFSEWEEQPGWMIWRVGHTKRQLQQGQPGHVLPLPLQAAAVVRAARSSIANSQWLFPQIRDGRRHKAGDHHFTIHQIDRAFSTGQLGFPPHRLRRALTSYLRDKGVPLSSSAKILHHSEGKTGVTAEFYDFAMDLEEKKGVLEKWVAFLEEVRKTD